MGERHNPPARYIAVVRRGETEVYRTLKEYLETRGLVEVTWDRRVGERRFRAGAPPHGADRRCADRRAPALDGSRRALGFFIARSRGAERAPPGPARDTPGAPAR
ncbi:MAG: hypothetical protein HY002_07690 [Candidatus Rokubacteria bacterium]|nr:hypothetical protein [Candidatus Rokubacteria bacterium]